MKELKRQDKNGVRTAVDLERRYKFKDIELTAEEVDELKELIEVDSFLSTSSIHPVQNKVITEALNNKVNKEAGKELSSNDFTDDYKQQIEDNTELRHIHNNMTLLQSYEQTEDDLRDAVSKRHKHSNKEVLDTITDEQIRSWNENSFSEYYKEQIEANTELRHIHNNMTLLQSYEQTEDDLRDAVGKRHTHSNKAVLDSITQAQINQWNTGGLTDDYKQQIEDNTELRHIHNNMTLLQSYEQTEDDLRDAVGKRHEHSNKALLDTYTQTNTNIADAVSKKHSHNNKAILDTITQDQIDKWNTDNFTADYKEQVEANTELRHIHNNMTLLQSYEQTEDNLRDAVTKKHEHSNKSLLDTYTQTNANIADAVSKKHSHSNKTVLDSITQAQVTSWNENSFTSDYKEQVEANTELRHIHNNMTLLQSYEQTEDNLRDAVTKRHTHSNKSLLDTYTQTEANLASAVSSKHTHSNKALLDTYTQTNANIASAVTNNHTHSNKALLDTYTQTNANIASAVTNNHTHSNKSVLDGITSTLISNWNNAASNAHSASVTSGTNTNTIRLGNVLIQSGRVSAKVTTGGTPIQLSFNFPVAFKNAPTLIMQPSTSAPNSIWVTTADSTTTQGKYWFYRPNTSATIVEWLAIGEGV